VSRLQVAGDPEMTAEILKRVQQFNYVPTRKIAEYGAGLLASFSKWQAEHPESSRS